MVGTRQRCMYCEDSRGTDIEHYRPQRTYPKLTFTWCNLLLMCAGCNRKKGAQFPIDSIGTALLIDPTVDKPWDHLQFDENTGNLVARWTNLGFDPKGAATTIPTTLPLNIEAILEGRLRTTRRLRRSVETYLRERAANGDPNVALISLRSAIADNDDFGLSQWFFRLDGVNSQPFESLRRTFPVTWTSCLEVVP